MIHITMGLEVFIMTNKKTYCTHCGQPTSRNKHSIARMLSNILMAVRHFQVPFHLQKDTSLTKNQYNNFQKLKYWGLVAKDGCPTGHWYITLCGKRFISGEITIPKWVKTFNNRVVEESKEYVSVHDCQKLSTTYKQAKEYIEDRDSHINEKELF